MTRVLGLVPARAGSKGVPGKNTRPLGGRPLLAHTADAALAATGLDRVVLSTDDPAIARLGEELGLDVPFLRPAALAGDTTPMLAVLQHALDELDRLDGPGGDGPWNAVCLLQPTSPFRPPGLVDRCVERFEATGADAVVTMVPVPPEHNPHWVYEPGPDGRLRLATGEAEPITRRQDLPPAYHRDGSVYVFAAAGVRAGRPYGTHVEAVLADPADVVNIDTPEDWARAEARWERGA